MFLSEYTIPCLRIALQVSPRQIEWKSSHLVPSTALVMQTDQPAVKKDFYQDNLKCFSVPGVEVQDGFLYK